MSPITSVDDPRYVKALSHPLRVRILGILEDRAASPVELSHVLDATLGTVSYHVRQLNDLDLLELVRETRRRGAIEHHYKARPRPGRNGAEWESVTVAAKQAVIGAELANTAEVARRAADVGGFDGEHARLERLRLTLDPQGLTQLSKAVAKLAADGRRIEEAAGRRLARATSPAPTDTALVTMVFDAVGAPDTAAGRPPAPPDRTRRVTRGKR